MKIGKLTLFCGKMGAGKTTKAKATSKRTNAILLSEDEWLSMLYPNEIHSLQDYVTYSARLKPLLKELVQQLLKNGLDVVLDFPANTVKQRQWLKTVFEESEAAHELIFLDTSDETCLAQIKQRNAEQPDRTNTDTETMFYQVTKYFEAPSIDEGFNVITIINHN